MCVCRCVCGVILLIFHTSLTGMCEFINYGWNVSQRRSWIIAASAACQSNCCSGQQLDHYTPTAEPHTLQVCYCYCSFGSWDVTEAKRFHFMLCSAVQKSWASSHFFAFCFQGDGCSWIFLKWSWQVLFFKLSESHSEFIFGCVSTHFQSKSHTWPVFQA